MSMAANPDPPQKYVMLEQHSNLKPPPYRKKLPRYHSGYHKSGGGCCLKCICCCYCSLIILIFIVAGVTFYFYTVFQPKVPSYKVDHIDVKTFTIQPDLTLVTEFVVNVKANNPNKHIGFIYGKDSSVVVTYFDFQLSSGQLPAFHQGHKNITMMKVVMKGKTVVNSDMQHDLMKDREKGKIPLLIRVVAPVRVVVGSVQTRQIKVLVNCTLVTDTVTPRNKVKILSTKYKVKVQF